MSKTQKALRFALEALEESLGYVEKEAENAQRLYGQYPTRQARIQGLKDDARKHMDAITAIREALAEQTVRQQVLRAACGNWGAKRKPEPANANAGKPWVGLTDEQIQAIAFEAVKDNWDWLKFARAIEAKLREKNA